MWRTLADSGLTPRDVSVTCQLAMNTEYNLCSCQRRHWHKGTHLLAAGQTSSGPASQSTLHILSTTHVMTVVTYDKRQALNSPCSSCFAYAMPMPWKSIQEEEHWHADVPGTQSEHFRHMRVAHAARSSTYKHSGALECVTAMPMRSSAQFSLVRV